MEKTLSETVLDEIEEFLAKTGMRQTAFGIQYNGDPSFVGRARKGRQMKADTIDGIRRFMREYDRPTRRRAGNDRVAA